jgi:Lrp/AsnC family transcriptional regulator, leucine-responsive regulatory protein
MPRLDAIDRRIIAALTSDARMSTVEIAERVGLSATPCARRIRELEKAGIIDGYTVRLNPAKLGLTISVMVSVKLSRHDPDGHEQFQKAVLARPEVAECLLVTGSYDYMLRIWLPGIEALATFVTSVLQGIPSVAETSTTVILDHKVAASGLADIG